jgi:hypothetical protein
VIGSCQSTCKRRGALSAALGNGSADLMIGATALEHGLTVVTRNISNFAPTGVDIIEFPTIWRGELAHVRMRLHPGTPNIPLEVAGQTPSPPPRAAHSFYNAAKTWRQSDFSRLIHNVLFLSQNADQYGIQVQVLRAPLPSPC